MSHNEFKKIREPIEPQEASPMKQEMTVLGIDLAKHVFHAVGMDNTGKIVFRKRLSRHDLVPFIPTTLLDLALGLTPLSMRQIGAVIAPLSPGK
jgi:hypothetical protein